MVEGGVLMPPAPAGRGHFTEVGGLELEWALVHVISCGALSWNLSLTTGRGTRCFHHTLFTSHPISSPREERRPCGVIIPSSEAAEANKTSVVTVTPHEMGFCAGGNLPLGCTGFETKKAASV